MVIKNLTAIFNFKRTILQNEDIFFSKLTPEKHLPAFPIFEVSLGTQDTEKTTPSVTGRVWRNRPLSVYSKQCTTELSLSVALQLREKTKQRALMKTNRNQAKMVIGQQRKKVFCHSQKTAPADPKHPNKH